MGYIGLTDYFYNELEKMKRTIRYSPIDLGGIIGSGGGVDGRAGGFIGRLPQTRVTYDKSELATKSTAGSPTLLDNLNHIRASVAGRSVYHGVTNRNNGISYNFGTRTVTVSGVLEYYFEGIRYLASGIIQTHPNTTGNYYLYYDSSNQLQYGTTPWSILTDVPILYTYYDSSIPIGISFDERHSHERNRFAHYEFHNTVGSYWHVSDGGLAIGDYTVQPVTPADSDNQWSLSASEFHDEDLEHTIPATVSGGPYTIAWRNGADGTWNWSTNNVPLLAAGGSYIYYNQFTGGAWQQTALTTNQYVNYYIVHLGSIPTNYRTVVIMGQAIHANLADAQAEDITSITWGTFPDIELISSYKVTFRTGAAYTSEGKCRISYVTDTRQTTNKQIVNATPASNHNSLSGLQGGTAGEYYHLTSAELALLSSVDSGATLPATPSIGDLFLHTPTGRKVLLQYDGSNWKNIISYGAMTMYVDGGSGSDDMDAGGASGASAFATIQYAVDRVPGLFGGNVTINVASGTYAGNVIINGKAPTGNYTITITGVLTNVSAGITVDGGVATNGATQGTVTDSGTSYNVAWKDKLLECTAGDNNGAIRVIDSATTGSLSLISTWAAYSAGGTYNVKDWGTIISGSLTINTGQKGIILNKLEISGAVVFQDFCSVTSYYCNLSNAGLLALQVYTKAVATFWYSLHEGNSTYAINTSGGIFLDMLGCKLSISASIIGINLTGASSLIFRYGSVLDNGSTYGISLAQLSYAGFATVAAQGYPQIRNCGTGIIATGNSVADGTANNVYSGNTTDESPSGASDSAYID